MRILAYGCGGRSHPDQQISSSLAVRVIRQGTERNAFAVLTQVGGKRELAELVGATVVRKYQDLFMHKLTGKEYIDFGGGQLRSDMEQLQSGLQSRIHRYCGRQKETVCLKTVAALFQDGTLSVLLSGPLDEMRPHLYCCEKNTFVEIMEEDVIEDPFQWHSASIQPNSIYMLCTDEIAWQFGNHKLEDLLRPDSLLDPLSVRMRLAQLINSVGSGWGSGAAAILIRFMEE